MTREELVAAVTRRAIERYQSFPEWQRQELDYGLQCVAQRTAEITRRNPYRGNVRDEPRGLISPRAAPFHSL
jgi:hypothetical protein